jgi:hypothetical protein
MESIKIEINKLVVEEMTIPPFFTLKGGYVYYKILSPRSYLAITNYEVDTESMENLEVYPSIRVDQVRYLEIFVKGKEIVEITEEEFKNQYKKCVTAIAKL